MQQVTLEIRKRHLHVFVTWLGLNYFANWVYCLKYDGPISHLHSPLDIVSQFQQKVKHALPEGKSKKFWKRKSLLATYRSEHSLVPLGHSDWEISRTRSNVQHDEEDEDSSEGESGDKYYEPGASRIREDTIDEQNEFSTLRSVRRRKSWN